ncbi:phage tail tape measure protein [Malaciobacter marinus]|uniref:phage tail tape measure protein n=1 Tax=Malaciobacter marinus TaxID=505249 RepID=UPI003B003994
MSTLLNIGIILSATDALSPVLGNATSGLDGFDNKIDETSANLTKLGTASLALGEGISSALGSTFDDIQELRAAQGELKTLGVEGTGLDAITQSAKEFASEFSGTTAPTFVKAAYDIKSGISSLSDTAVGEMTSIAAMTASATKSSTAEMTSLFATGYGIYRDQFEQFGSATIDGWNKLSDEEKDIKFGEYFSAGISNSVQAFKTDGTQMSAALSNLGASATSAGVSFSEQLSILGQLQATMSGSEAATKYRAFLTGAVKANESLGLSFLDANNKLVSMPEILEQLRDKYGSVLDGMEKKELYDAFGSSEALALIELLYPKTENLTNSINTMNTSLQDGSKKTREMALSANEGKEQEVLDQKINNLTSTIGDRFAPVMLFTIDTMGSVVDGVTSWMDEHETLSTVIVSGIGILGGLLTVLGTVGVVAGGIGMILPFLSGGFGLVTASMGVMVTATKAVTAALMSNPIGLIAAGIATAAYLIYDNWEPIGEFFSDLWGGIQESAAPVLDFLDTGISAIGDFFGFGSSEPSVTVNQNEPEGARALQSQVMAKGVDSNYEVINKGSQQNSTRVIKQDSTYHVTVTNPTSNVDIEKALKDADRKRRNRQLEDLD